MDEKQLLQEAVSEIRNLRKSNQLMSTRLRMFDDMMLVINTNVDRGGGCEAPDLCYKIEQFLSQPKA